MGELSTLPGLRGARKPRAERQATPSWLTSAWAIAILVPWPRRSKATSEPRFESASSSSTMSLATKRRIESEAEPVRVLSRGLRAQRGVHLTLRILREATGKTQADIAAASGIDQADISRLESRESLRTARSRPFREYVAALGGDLELVAAFGNKKIAVTGVQPLKRIEPLE